RNNQSNALSTDVVQQQLNELLNEPISEQYQRQFRKYFGANITTKTFTIHEFAHLFQVTSLLNKQILITFKLNESLYLISIPDQDKEEDEENSCLQRFWMYIKNNASRIAFILLNILIQIGSIVYVIVDRVGVMLVNFNYTIAISKMLKQTMTIIRRLCFLRLIMPVDDHIDAHRLVGTILFISSIVHTFGHVIQFATHTEENKIYEHFLSQSNNDDADLNEVTIDQIERNYSTNQLLLSSEIKFTDNQKDAVACTEGPFSTCTSYIFDCEHVVFIGAGIGITPYISALESLIYRLREQHYKCFHCGSTNYKQEILGSRKLIKVDFIWVNRDIRNISWFYNILNDFELEQEPYLNATTNMHTQLQTPTHVGRPPWKLLFAKFKVEHSSTNIFFTGNETMGGEIKSHCNEHGFTFQHEPFF
ncbi:unnamed protein product, partial [Rotaria socialis]